MFARIEVYYKERFPDPVSSKLKTAIETIGIYAVTNIRTVNIFLIEGALSGEDIENICSRLLVDCVTQDYTIRDLQPEIPNPKSQIPNREHVIEVSRKPDVMDVAEASILKGIRDIGPAANSVKRAIRYIISGSLTKDQCKTIANKILVNSTIEDAYIDTNVTPINKMQLPDDNRQLSFEKQIVELIDKNDKELTEISTTMQLSLDLHEMKAVKDYFATLKREPSDIELETIAQTWSEHCVHKTLKGTIEYNGNVIENLLSSTIVKATEELDKPWCVSVFKDNAGIIEFDDEYNVCFKVETHNHPSAIVPYGGATTGTGGVIRDILGTGLGGRPILNTDVFCFGHPDLPQDKVPDGALHPRRIMNGVVSGVRDYGNRMGIPTSNGSIFFDKRYIGNPLVFCGTVGLIPVDRCAKEPEKGDLIILAGGRTGRDGIHGVTFASVGLDKESETDSSCAVQIGNPITEKKLTEVLLEARDKGLYSCITDCGGGGLSSAIGEMGEELGVEVHLDKVPLKYAGLSYSDIWISEAQERMVMSVSPKNEKEIINIFKKEDVEAATIGRFTGDKDLHLIFNNITVGRMDMEFLHNGLPKIIRKAEWNPVQFEEPDLEALGGRGQKTEDSDRLAVGELPETRNPKSQISNQQSAIPNLKSDYGNDLKKILSSWNVCSKETVIRQYDHEVQGTSVLKPLQGVDNDGPGDACIIAPVHGSKRGIIVSNGMNPKYGDIDAYHMTASGIDEALRQIIAVGGNLDQVALIDNFCWGDTRKPECLGSLVRAAQACYDYSKWYGTPFISGKDSLYNEFDNGSESISIPPTLLISAVAIMPDITKAVSMDAKKSGNLIYIVGETKSELGGSHYYLIHGYIGNSVPQVDADSGKKIMNGLSKASDAGLIRSCHDCSEGGFAVAAAEMSFAGGLGMDLNIEHIPTDNGTEAAGIILFSESNSRFVVEVSPENRCKFEDALKDVPFGLLGSVQDNDRFVVKNKNNSIVISENIYDLKECWQRPLKAI
ncbi:MAG: phosphoribosylformylglycinamidine synthase subunit PurS [Candidatus Anammoxibacter sp.]